MKRIALATLALGLLTAYTFTNPGSMQIFDWGLSYTPGTPPNLGGGGTVACDVGPPFQGAIPGPAAAFGFTHCINFDFSYTGTFSNAVSFYDQQGVQHAAGQSYQWSNLASWWKTSGATAPLFITSGGNTNSNQAEIITDSTTGKQVLHLQVVPPGVAGAVTQISSLLYPGTNSFVELVVRLDPNAPSNVLTNNGNGEIIDDFGMFSNINNAVGSGLETDFGAVCSMFAPPTTQPLSAGSCGNDGGTGSFFWLNGNGSGQSSTLSPTGIVIGDGAYHTTATLAASSLTNQAVAYCGYVDHQFGTGHNCVRPSISGHTSPCNPAQGPTIMCYQSTSMNFGSYSETVSAKVEQWVARFTVWTCPGWNAAPNTNPGPCDSGALVPSDNGAGPAWPAN